MPAQGEFRLDPLLDRRYVQFLEAGDLRLRERLVGEVRQRLPAPEVESIPQQLGSGGHRSGRHRPPPVIEPMLEPLGINRARLNAEEVTAGAGEHHLTRRPPRPPGLERLTKLRDIHLQGVCGRLRRPRSPQVVDEAVG